GGRLLGRPNEDVRLPSRRALRALARRYGVESLSPFGSAVRSEFRPDSDVDVVVRYLPGGQPSLRASIELEHALEEAIGRDVDLLREDVLEAAVRACRAGGGSAPVNEAAAGAFRAMRSNAQIALEYAAAHPGWREDRLVVDAIAKRFEEV